MGDFKRLIVWQRAREVAGSVYRATSSFPPSERFGMTGQLRRAAISVASNIAESCGRHGRGDEIRFLRIAQGSAHELESLLLISRDLAYLEGDTHEAVLRPAIEVQVMLAALIRRKQRQRSLT